MENWRGFRLEEEEGPKFKENPKDAVELLGKIVKLDQKRLDAVAEKIASDPDVAPVISALEELFKELESESVEEGVVDDLSIGGLGAALGGANKVSEFLEASPAGRVLKKVSGPVLGIALLGLFAQQPDGGQALQSVGDTIAKVMTSSDPATMLAGSAEGLVDVMVESLQERKKA